MRKILFIILFLFFGCNSEPPEKHGSYSTMYSSGNLYKEMSYHNGNLTSLIICYDKPGLSPKRGDFPSFQTNYYDNKQQANRIEYYLNGNTKSKIEFDRKGETIAIYNQDRLNNNIWGFNTITGWIKTEPFGMDTDDRWNDYCNKDQKNSNHSWDQFYLHGDLVWRCRGWDNGQFVENCNCKDYINVDTQWPDKTNNIS